WTRGPSIKRRFARVHHRCAARDSNQPVGSSSHGAPPQAGRSRYADARTNRCSIVRREVDAPDSIARSTVMRDGILVSSEAQTPRPQGASVLPAQRPFPCQCSPRGGTDLDILTWWAKPQVTCPTAAVHAAQVIDQALRFLLVTQLRLGAGS